MPSIEKDLKPTNDSDAEHDQPFLTEDPLTILKEGRFNKVPILMGFNSNEAMLFIRREFIQFIITRVWFDDITFEP